VKIQWALLAALTAFILASCTPTEDAIPTEPLTSPPQESISTPRTDYPPQGDKATMTPISTTPAASDLQNLIEKAKGDLAQRLSIPENEIILLKATDVVWPNSSLGCPQKGMVYAEVLTPGYLIILSVENQEFEYHASRGTELIYCPNPTPPLQGAPDIPTDQ
jgi:hypothetical protein